jgi:hypothetical protein
MAFRFKEGAQGTKGTISAAISAMHQAVGYNSPIHNKVVFDSRIKIFQFRGKKGERTNKDGHIRHALLCILNRL